jgi:3-phosphoshikimate 1-carboxyvinyltransferase
MAMSFAIAGLVADGVVIKDVECVSKSFPGFFDVLGSLCVAT